MPDFVYYLISGAVGALGISIGHSIGEKYIPYFPDMALILSRIIDWGKPEPEKTARIIGRYAHLLMGALWGLLYGILVDQQFFFLEFNVVQGMIFSLIPWLVLMTIVMPALKQGFFASKINKYQWLAGLFLHLLYGAVLGFLLSIFTNTSF